MPNSHLSLVSRRFLGKKSRRDETEVATNHMISWQEIAEKSYEIGYITKKSYTTSSLASILKTNKQCQGRLITRPIVVYCIALWFLNDFRARIQLKNHPSTRGHHLRSLPLVKTNLQKSFFSWTATAIRSNKTGSARVSDVFGVKNAEKSGPDAKKLDIGSHWWRQENGKNGRNPCCWRQIKTSPTKI